MSFTVERKIEICKQSPLSLNGIEVFKFVKT